MANIQKLKENLERYGYIVSYYETAAEAKDALVAAIKGKTVGFGGSCTLRDMGLYEALSEENEVFWHWKQQPINEARAKANASPMASRRQGDSVQVVRTSPKVGRNDPCPCGSGKKYKQCCGR